MLGLGTILSIVGGVSETVNVFKFVSTLAKGSDASRALGELSRIRAQVERLSDNILYAPAVEGLRDTAGAAHRLSGLREARELLEPVQMAVGGEILSSGLIGTPHKMERAMAANPWAVLEDIRPQHLAVRPANPDKVPVLFMLQGMHFIGWQMRGVLPVLFDCELHDLPGLGASLRPEVLDIQAVPPIPARDTRPAWAAAAASDKYGRWAEFGLGGVTQRMRWIAPGSFMMGSPKDEPGRFDNEGPLHEVRLTKGFWLCDTPVTQALWTAAMGGNPSYFKHPKRPVEQVSWDDAQQFLQKMNARVSGLDLMLPTEAQWEYACRAGTDKATYGGPMQILGDYNAPVLDGIAWYGGNSGVGFELDNGVDSSGWSGKQYSHSRAGTRPVGLKTPNDWGLYDMLGNVWEWCADDFAGL